MRKSKEIEEQQGDAVTTKIMDQTTCGEHVRKNNTNYLRIEETNVSRLSFLKIFEMLKTFY